MADKFDFKKEYKDLYMPKEEPVLIEVPRIRYLMVDGIGAPGGKEYQEALQLLYSIAFTIKMSKLSGAQPEGYIDYIVPPLEGLWELPCEGSWNTDRDKWHWTSLLRQPEFVTQEVFLWACEQAAAKAEKKGRDTDYSKIRLEEYEEGLCVQVMHTGPYAEEQAALDRLETFASERGLRIDCGSGRRHHEIYLKDPRRCKPENLKTVLRQPVAHLA